MSYTTRSNYRPGSAITVTLDDRVGFIRKTYLHLAGAIGLFVLLSTAFYTSGFSQTLFNVLFGGGGFIWLAALLVFGGVGYGAQAMARNSYSRGMQYMGLGLYTLIEALIFAPFLFLAQHYAPNVLGDAAILTLATFTGLSGFVIIYNKDFSFLGGFIAVASMIALGVIVVGLIFGFNLGVWFSAGMILLASLCILYSTSNILRYYPPDMYVAAALELFAEIALLFWYVLRLLMELQRK